MGQPDNLALTLNFNYEKITERFKAYLNKFIDRFKENSEYQKLVCVGHDDNKIESVFNINKIINKVVIKANKDKFGSYDKEKVKRDFINRIKSNTDV